MSQNDEYTIEILRDLGLLTRHQIEEARANIGPHGLLRTLVESGVVSEEDVVRALASQNSMEFVDIDEATIDHNAIKCIEGDDARRYQALPIGFRESALIVAIADPMAM